MSEFTEGDLIVGSTSSGGVRRVWRVVGYAAERAWDIESGSTANIDKLFGVQRATVNRVADLFPESKKRFVKAAVNGVKDTNFHIFDHETRKYLSFVTEATRNLVVNGLNQGSEPSFHEWTDTPDVSNGMNFRVTITNPVAPPVKKKSPRYAAYTSALRDDTHYHIIDTETGKYTSYFQKETRDEMLCRFNNNGVKYYVNWQDKPAVSSPKPKNDYSSLISEAEFAAEAHERYGNRAVANLVRRLIQVVRDGD